MSGPAPESPTKIALPSDDLIRPFSADQADVLGRLVKLGPTIDTILSRHAYPEPVSRLLGEAVALTAMLGASLKSEGKLILQASTDGPVDLLVADYVVPGSLRAYARFDEERLAGLDSDDDDAALLGQGHFAMTIDRLADADRYQGVVPLEGTSLTEAADHYFQQSEQLPTFIRLAVARHYQAGADGEGVWSWRAGGLLVQKLTREGGTAHKNELEEDWNRAKMLAETVEDHELLDPLLSPERLLYRLFHEEQVRVYRPIALNTYCSCSRDRVEDMLRRFTPEDIAGMTVDGELWVDCEFCNAHYSFDPKDFSGG